MPLLIADGRFHSVWTGGMPICVLMGYMTAAGICVLTAGMVAFYDRRYELSPAMLSRLPFFLRPPDAELQTLAREQMEARARGESTPEQPNRDVKVQRLRALRSATHRIFYALVLAIWIQHDCWPLDVRVKGLTVGDVLRGWGIDVLL